MKKNGFGFMLFLKIATVVCIIAAAAVGLFYLTGYVRDVSGLSGKTAAVKLLNPPKWINHALEEKIYAAVTAYGENLRLDEDVAASVQKNIQSQVAWLDDVKIRATHESILITADYRKPIALIKRGLHKFYVDSELVVLDYIPMPSVPTVKVEGLPATTPDAKTGQVWHMEDLAAAVAILDKLDKTDKQLRLEKPLLNEIDRIDISNFNGRESQRAPHIILYAIDNTEIIWGAELEKWKRNLEAPDEEKIAKLYDYYRDFKGLTGEVKYINLMDPRDGAYQPID